jgi:UDP-N-acetylmuramoyl-tripeptide--D-alanyl-D-alanine ligase
MTPLWTLKALAPACWAQGDFPDVAISGIQFDSRAVKAGDLFLAMPGSNVDGHTFVALAAEKGAVAALVREVQAGAPIPQLVVPHVQRALEQIGAAARARYKGHVVAVGGSVGKTTTTAMLAALLNAHAPLGSLNNHVGVPLTMARLPEKASAFVAEIGTNKVGEIAPLAKTVRPYVALITNVVEEHLEGLGSLEAVRLEEVSIAQGLQPNGILVAPEGLSLEGSSWQGKVVRFNPATPIDMDFQEKTIARMACLNGALAVLNVLGITPDAAALGRLAALQPVVGRGQVIEAAGVTLIDDSYNANPASMAAGLQAFQTRVVKGRKFAILRELGAGEADFHKALAPQVEGLTGVVLLGPLMGHLKPLLPPQQLLAHYPNPDDFLAEDFAKTLKAGDAVLVKGSKSITFVRHIVQRLQKTLQIA